MWKKIIVLAFVMLATASLAMAQQNDPDPFADPFSDSVDQPIESGNGDSGSDLDTGTDDFDSLFDDGNDITEAKEDESSDLSSELLEDTGVRWSGRFIGNISAGFFWHNFIDDGIIRKTDTNSFDTEIGGVLRFNARPDKNFRVAGKFGISTDLVEIGKFANLDAGTGPFDPQDSIVYEDLISVDELFADFNYKNKLFFRFGKSFIKWGAGYFWSPADFLNLEPIDIEDPTAKRQGPVNLKVNHPFSSNNINLYVLLQDVDAVENVGVALNTELVAGKFELGFGGYYQYQKKPRIVATFSGSIWKIGMFGEAALSFGSEKTLLKEGPGHTTATPNLIPYTKDWEPIFFGTIGAMYLNTDYNITLLAQYYFNGEGYPNTEYDNGQSMLELATLQVIGGSMNASDLVNFSRHYLGLSAIFSELADSDFSISTYVLMSMSDWSGIAAVTFSYTLFDRAVISLVPRILFGQDGDEFTPLTYIGNELNPLTWIQQPQFDLTLKFSLGEDRF